MQKHPYGDNFYKNQRDISLQSAREIVPLVMQLVQPSSVIDVGCGVGGWLSTFQAQGVDDIQGVDGDYVNKALLVIPKERFIEFDLKKPFRLERQFDLVTSLEVAEHLPPECADIFVDSLVSLGPVILFSAAVPFQAGINHLNEQWQDYWAKRFGDRGYLAVDYLRKQIWQNEQVAFWYAQNTLLYVRSDYLEQHPELKREYEATNKNLLAIAHPKMFTDMGITRLLSLLRLFPFAVNRALRKRMNRLLAPNRPS